MVSFDDVDRNLPVTYLRNDMETEAQRFMGVLDQPGRVQEEPAPANGEQVQSCSHQNHSELELCRPPSSQSDVRGGTNPAS